MLQNMHDTTDPTNDKRQNVVPPLRGGSPSDSHLPPIAPLLTAVQRSGMGTGGNSIKYKDPGLSIKLIFREEMIVYSISLE